ncbi:MAG TPA: DUF4157 domain-containing protein [Kofleriaceae bacterium]|nr:DUF4157 domain-containing protein [Kofleriaceae bacterium]
MRNPERRFRHEPDRLEGGEGAGLSAEGEREESWLPEKNSDRAAVAQEARTGRGSSLDARAQSAASQAGFGNVGGVRVHTGAAASTAASSIGARAFTVGQNIFFGAGEYNPGTAAGDELLGQELAHTAQQQGAVAPRGGAMEMTTPGDAVESQADRAGSSFAMAAQGAMVQQASITRSSNMAVARDVKGSMSAADLAARTTPLLDPAKRAAAMQFNSGRRLPPEVWTQVSGVIGAAPQLPPGEMAEKIARFQATQGFTVDGKLADVTLQRVSQQSGGSGLEKFVRNDSIVYLGLNPGSRGVETETLRNGAGAGNVTSITQRGANQDTAVVAGHTVDLTTPAGLDALVASCSRLDAATQAKLRAFIENASSGSRDELAQLVGVLYQAELGQRLMKRFVLSGHSGGGSVWGDDNGSLDFSYLPQLAEIFPNAMGQVEDLMLSACNTGYNANIPAYLSIFRNLKSVWAYVGYSPSAGTGSTRHITQWEKSTRGAMQHGTVNAGRERVNAGTGPRDHNVAIWTRESSTATAQYETDSPYLTNDYASLRATVDSRLHHYETALTNGNINQSELDDIYVQLQTLTGQFAGDLGGDLARFQLIVKKVLFLRHWRNISSHFMAEHGNKVRAAYAAAGATMPPFGSLSRSEALGKIRDYPGSTSHEGYALLTGILRDLDPNQIPDNWI